MEKEQLAKGFIVIKSFIEYGKGSRKKKDLATHLETFCKGAVKKSEFEEIFKMNIGDVINQFNPW